MNRCAACHRPLKKPAVQHGYALYGPTCAKRFGLTAGSKTLAPERDDKTADLFDEKKGDEK